MFVLPKLALSIAWKTRAAFFTQQSDAKLKPIATLKLFACFNSEFMYASCVYFSFKLTNQLTKSNWN